MKGGLQPMTKRYNTPHRSRVVKTRLSEDEYADFTARLTPYDISQSEFLRQAIRRTTIRPVLHLPVGKYYVKEAETAHGYVLDGEPRYVDLSYRDQDTPVVTYDEAWQNNRQKVKVTVLKKEKDTERVLAGGIFGLFTREDIKNVGGDVLLEADTLIELKTTDENGQITFTADLPVDGNYYVKELYAAARESTLNAHYTQPVIIESMYRVLQNLGFEKGNILEPSMGVGNFFGMLPDKLQQSRLYGVELDSISGRIAKLLYPNADIQIKGFEKTDYPNDFFDVAIGNVPFGSYKVNDRQYDKYHFMIHDYFLAKTIDQLRPGGVAALITTKGTMDKASPEVRKYLAERAELLGAIRLPNNAFKANAGTEVSADILFFQKRESISMEEPEWVALGEDKNGITINQYFITHPEMVLGTMAEVSGPYGMETACLPLEGTDLAEQLEDAASKIHGTMVPTVTAETELDEIMESIPADPSVRNYSFTVVDDQVYYRVNSLMNPVKLPSATAERVKGMVEIREVVRELIALQMEENATDEAIQELQVKLNQVYDTYTEKYGVIGSNANKRAFSDDSSYCLLCSLEDLNEDGTLKRKADMFTKRTIKKAVAVTSVETATEALTISLNEKARVDLPYMAGLTGKPEEKVAEELTGVIFRDPVNEQWETADEYLSGNVREKLKTAKIFAENHPEFTSNVQALKQVQPVDLDASEIEVLSLIHI